eukprot:CAMPEP_0194242332 /NCGR_PEP_ID=MMETSP0158-20130606/7898_1 /TAXON_ID=33649 /ORGANISM="Thalassionema nitzschioides, Strain L26-B" /LENGTH=194 /DNA_ID=CAMNT_0038977397 /DNA_START=73 /DNA_END=654 /DNA_ORIENTATION=+
MFKKITKKGGMNQHDPYEKIPKARSFNLESDDLVDGGDMPAPRLSKIAGIEVGSDKSPSLRWDGFDKRTKSFMVTCFDPDAPIPSGFWHWCLYDIPLDITELEAGAGNPDKSKLPIGAKMLKNDAGFAGYIGAAPPPGTPHRYIFCVTALGTPELQNVTEDSSIAFSTYMALEHVLGRAFLTVSFKRDGVVELW